MLYDFTTYLEEYELNESLNEPVDFFMTDDTEIPRRIYAAFSIDGTDYGISLEESNFDKVYHLRMYRIVNVKARHWSFRKPLHVRKCLATLLKFMEACIPFIKTRMDGIIIPIPGKANPERFNTFISKMIRRTYVQTFRQIPVKRTAEKKEAYNHLFVIRRTVNPNSLFKTKQFKKYDFDPEDGLPDEVADEIEPNRRERQSLSTKPSEKYQFKGIKIDSIELDDPVLDQIVSVKKAPQTKEDGSLENQKRNEMETIKNTFRKRPELLFIPMMNDEIPHSDKEKIMAMFKENEGKDIYSWLYSDEQLFDSMVKYLSDVIETYGLSGTLNIKKKSDIMDILEKIAKKVTDTSFNTIFDAKGIPVKDKLTHLKDLNHELGEDSGEKIYKISNKLSENHHFILPIMPYYNDIKERLDNFLQLVSDVYDFDFEEAKKRPISLNEYREIETLINSVWVSQMSGDDASRKIQKNIKFSGNMGTDIIDSVFASYEKFNGDSEKMWSEVEENQEDLLELYDLIRKQLSEPTNNEEIYTTNFPIENLSTNLDGAGTQNPDTYMEQEEFLNRKVDDLHSKKGVEIEKIVNELPNGQSVMATLQSYTGNGYKNMNRHLREVVKKFFESPESINAQEAAGLLESGSNIALMYELFKNIEPIDEPLWVYRDTNFPRSVFDELQAGEDFTDPAYMSTSLNSRIDFTGRNAFHIHDTKINVVSRIYLPKGSKILPVDEYSENKGEAEVILPPLTVLKPLEIKVKYPQSNLNKALVTFINMGSGYDDFIEKLKKAPEVSKIYENYRSFNMKEDKDKDDRDDKHSSHDDPETMKKILDAIKKGKLKKK